MMNNKFQDFKVARKNPKLFIDLFENSDGFGGTLGAKVISIDDEKCVYEYIVNAAHFNPGGILHGGVLFSIMDSSQGAFIHYILDDQFTRAVTGTATIRYEKPLKSGTVTIVSTLLKQDGRKYYIRSEAMAQSQLVASLDEVWIAT